jgi:hypothetical protein
MFGQEYSADRQADSVRLIVALSIAFGIFAPVHCDSVTFYRVGHFMMMHPKCMWT